MSCCFDFFIFGVCVGEHLVMLWFYLYIFYFILFLYYEHFQMLLFYYCFCFFFVCIHIFCRLAIRLFVHSSFPIVVVLELEWNRVLLLSC